MNKNRQQNLLSLSTCSRERQKVEGSAILKLAVRVHLNEGIILEQQQQQKTKQENVSYSYPEEGNSRQRKEPVQMSNSLKYLRNNEKATGVIAE